MPVRSARALSPIIYIPPVNSAAFALTVTASDATVDTITNYITKLEIEDGATESIGRFEFEIWDPNEDYVGVWSGGEVVRYYSDYAATATTLRFRGRIEKVSYQGNKLKVTGRSESLKFMDITVTKSFNNTDTSEILKSLIDTYGSGFTYSNIETSNTNLTVTWTQKPFWECIQEICTAAGFDCYVDASLDFHYFRSGTVKNQYEGIVHEYNLIEVGEFAEDLALIKNRIIVYGAEQDGIQIIYTADDLTSQAAYGIKEETVNDDNIIDYASAQELADYYLVKYKDPPIVGEIKSLLMASIQPGQAIKISSPADNIPPAAYVIISYKHNISSDGLFTSVKVNKEPRHISHVLKKQIERQYQSEQTSSNPYEMRYSYNFLFDEDTGTHSNTEITDGILKLVSGSAGHWISTVRTTTSNITEAYLVLVGSKVTGAVVGVSVNGGSSYQTIGNKQRIVITNPDKRLRIKVTFSDAATQIDSLSVQYK